MRKEGYKERLHQQTLDWSNGRPWHNNIDGECCPDFSCCHPELLAPKKVRERFLKAEQEDDESTKTRMLGEFLSKMLDKELPENNIRIIS